MTFWHSQKGVSKKIKATAGNIFLGAPETPKSFTLSASARIGAPPISNLKNVPTGLGAANTLTNAKEHWLKYSQLLRNKKHKNVEK